MSAASATTPHGERDTVVVISGADPTAAAVMAELRSRQVNVGLRSGGSRNQGRADIRAKYGFDTKFAAHMVRLGLPGVELLTTGDITLPIPEPELTWLRELRTGQHTKDEALDRAEQLEQQIDQLMAGDQSVLPEHPDVRAVEAWMASVYRRAWGW